ncbi:MAG: MmcQ/YjbR family DNA-binding protein [Flavobacteriales bacterium]|nr:MmcQ/YjbR family DNA-binding protein [Flavobacteriales bacterium]
MDDRTARDMALDMPGTAVKERYDRPSYSVKKRTYMTVWPVEQRAMLKLTPQQQSAHVDAHPDVFSPSAKARGRYGWTDVHLADVDDRVFRYVLDLAWRNVAPKWLVATRVAPPRG